MSMRVMDTDDRIALDVSTLLKLLANFSCNAPKIMNAKENVRFHFSSAL